MKSAETKRDEYGIDCKALVELVHVQQEDLQRKDSEISLLRIKEHSLKRLVELYKSEHKNQEEQLTRIADALEQINSNLDNISSSLADCL